MMLKDANSALGVSSGAGVDDIKRAYRQRAKRLHPDLNRSKDASERFYQLTEAYREALHKREIVHVSIQDMHRRCESEAQRKEHAYFTECVEELRTVGPVRRKVWRIASRCGRVLIAIGLLAITSALFAEGLYPGSLSTASESLTAAGIDVSSVFERLQSLMQPLRALFT